jgi:hypothetical protein
MSDELVMLIMLGLTVGWAVGMIALDWYIFEYQDHPR